MSEMYTQPDTALQINHAATGSGGVPAAIPLQGSQPTIQQPYNSSGVFVDLQGNQVIKKQVKTICYDMLSQIFKEANTHMTPATDNEQEDKMLTTPSDRQQRKERRAVN